MYHVDVNALTQELDLIKEENRQLQLQLSTTSTLEARIKDEIQSWQASGTITGDLRAKHKVVVITVLQGLLKKDSTTK